MKKETEELLKKKAREISIKEGAIYSISEGIGMRFITPYALTLGANNAQIGMLNSLPQFLGSISQIYTINQMPKNKRKKLVFGATLLQAFMWLIIITIGILPFLLKIKNTHSATLLILTYSLLIIAGNSIIPAWSSWMRDIVPENNLGAYFGARNRICGIIVLISMLIGSLILDYFTNINFYLGFTIIFAIAFISRFYSSMLFLKKYEPEFSHQKSAYFSFFQFLKRMSETNFGRFTIYISLILFATNLASPFFAVYMLKNLGFNYISYVFVISASTITILLFMPAWGRFADHYGNRKVLHICGLMIPLIPLLWLFSPILYKYYPALVMPYLITVELFAGFTWAGFNISSSNFIFASVSRQKLAYCVAYFNILENAGVLTGALLGGFIATQEFKIIGLTSILFVFLLSGIFRLAVSLILFPNIKEVQNVRNFGIKEAREVIMHLTPGDIFRILR